MRCRLVKRIELMVIAALLAFQYAGVASAQAEDGSRDITQKSLPKPQHPLTDAQRKRLGEVRDKFELDTAQQAAELHVAEHKLMELLGETSVDKQAALGMQSKINTLRNQLSIAQLNLALDSQTVFTPEQREEMKQMHHHFGPALGGPCFFTAKAGPGHFGMPLPGFPGMAPPGVMIRGLSDMPPPGMMFGMPSGHFEMIPPPPFNMLGPTPGSLPQQHGRIPE
jgi:Spy/CpxP family protein refolding chaperone